MSNERQPEPRVLKRPRKGESMEYFQRRVISALLGLEEAERAIQEPRESREEQANPPRG